MSWSVVAAPGAGGVITVRSGIGFPSSRFRFRPKVAGGQAAVNDLLGASNPGIEQVCPLLAVQVQAQAAQRADSPDRDGQPPGQASDDPPVDQDRAALNRTRLEQRLLLSSLRTTQPNVADLTAAATPVLFVSDDDLTHLRVFGQPGSGALVDLDLKASGPGHEVDSRASCRLRQLRTRPPVIASSPPPTKMKVPLTLTWGGTPSRVAP